MRKTDDLLSTLFTVQMLISFLFQPKTQDAAYYINIAIIIIIIIIITTTTTTSGLFSEVMQTLYHSVITTPLANLVS